MNTINLKEAPGRASTDALRGAPGGQVIRDGGIYGAGLIERVSIITAGEALGHEAWIDATMLEQTVQAFAAAGETGIKARFKHPGVSSDGTGKLLGRYQNGVIEGDKVLADLHFAESAHDTPSGDLAGYVMNVAAETPDLFGTSIAFKRDIKAERGFYEDNSQKLTDGDRKGEVIYGTFVSPDPANTRNLPHVRLAELRASDVVDSPAANPSGMFSAELSEQEAMVEQFEKLLGFIFSGGECPAFSDFPVHPDRAKAFVSRYLANQGLQISPVKNKRTILIRK